MKETGVSGYCMTLGDLEEDGDSDDKNVIILWKQNVWHFVMTKKHAPDRILESTEVLLEFTEKIMLKQAMEKKLCTF